MASFLDKLSNWAESADETLTRTRARLGLLHPLPLLPYRSYGTPERLYVKGRLLTDKGIGEPHPADSRWHYLLEHVQEMVVFGLLVLVGGIDPIVEGPKITGLPAAVDQVR